MSTPIIVAIITVCIVAIIVLRSQRRKSLAASVPRVTYVDETLLDLVRTRQISAATAHYQQHSGASARDAARAIEYLVRRPEALLLIVRVLDGETPSLYMDDTLKTILKQGRIMKAINYYSKQTGADLREAQIAVEALYVNPEMRFTRG